MSVPFSGTLRRSGGVVSAIGKQLRAVNLKAAKQITVKFDPFCDDVKHTRIPKDPKRREQWLKAIRLERQDTIGFQANARIYDHQSEK